MKRMYKILILEDEVPQLERLTGFLRRFGEENADFKYSVASYGSGVMFLTDYKCDADLIFLDIRVPDMLGIDVARKIRETDDSAMIVFVTSLAQYAIDGYSVDAFDYILKPIQYPSFSAKLRRILRVLGHRESELTIEVRTREDVRRIRASEIIYVESSSHDIFFHTDGETCRQWGTLLAYEEKLRDAGFARINTSFLVNLKYVEAVRKDEVVAGGAVLPLSRSKRKEFLTVLAKYKGGTR